MATGRASAERDSSQLGATSKAAPPQPGVVAPKPEVAQTHDSYVEFSLASINFGLDQQMLQGRVCI